MMQTTKKGRASALPLILSHQIYDRSQGINTPSHINFDRHFDAKSHSSDLKVAARRVPKRLHELAALNRSPAVRVVPSHRFFVNLAKKPAKKWLIPFLGHGPRGFSHGLKQAIPYCPNTNRHHPISSMRNA